MRDFVAIAQDGRRDLGHWLLAGLIVATLAGGCAASGNPPATVATTLEPTAAATATPATPAPTPTSAPVSQAAVVRCAETPNAKPAVTVHWSEPVVGPEPTIKAGQAVAFVTTGFSPTVTEGVNGTPAASACIDKAIGSDTSNGMSVVVTFYEPGDYNITCRKSPADMHTVVHVR